jgi:hypothetical protein
MTDDDPVPLKAGGDATPELVRALYALGRRDPDVARLARVAERLGAALADLPPPGSSNRLRRLLGTKTLITGIVIGIAALSWFGYHVAGRRVPAPESAPPPSATESSRLDPVPNPLSEVAPSNSSDSSDSSKATDHFASTIAPLATGPSDAPRASVAPARRSPRRAVPAQPAVAVPSQSPPATPNGSSATPTPTAAVASAPVASSPIEQASPAQSQRAPAQEASPVQRSEVELLFDARKVMPSQPAAALRLLEEHATRFPNGMLGPEREVLTIEALRKLGRTAEAAKRLRQFESRYPESIHLRRLQGGAGAP